MPLKIFICLILSLCLSQASIDDFLHLTNEQEKQLQEMEQDLYQPKDPHAKPLSPLEKKIKTIRTINTLIVMGEEFLQKNETLLKEAKNTDEKLELREIEKKISLKLNELRTKLMDTTSGVSEAEYLNIGKNDESSLTKEARTVLSPLLGEFHNMTAWPRELSRLQGEQNLYATRLDMAKQALKNIRELRANAKKNGAFDKTPKGSVKFEEASRRIGNLESVWSSRATDSKAQLDIVNAKIEEGAQNAPSIGKIFTIVFQKLWEKLGLNLMIALGVFFGSIFSLRIIYKLLRKVSPLHKRKDNSTRNHALAHLADLTAFYFSLAFSICAVLTTLYIRGDGLLITILVLILIWMGWSMRNEIPAYIARSRLMLNLGSMRVGERVIYQNLPWRVESINLFCEFRNPALEGGRIRIPLKDALSLVSRHAIPGESWFPTKQGDCYILPNGERATILRQTVEQITVDLATGGTKIYNTLDFLKLNPEVMTQGFDLVLYFGLDYSLQGIITTTVPEILQERLSSAAKTLIAEKNIQKCFVEFNRPLESSLELIFYIKVKGNHFNHYVPLKRLINKIFVETCTEMGWNIPYPHLTITQKAPNTSPHPFHDSSTEIHPSQNV